MEKRGLPEYSPPGIAPPPNYSPAVPIPEVVPPPGPSTSCPAPIPEPVFGPNPQRVTCPSCRSSITTRVEAESSTRTHIIAALLCLVSCCCLPYLIDSCKNKNHYCPSCGAYLGAYTN
ncbi:hypothetical protein ILUMI_09088 [Ignelater luminosus]|uniref:LITAF domain-containing protein n=1 Tax=Ignelater luminosus TaxID=2038154 RepID=A0A8K0GGC9_IGNLU|nr:hypothetical protein ILUMI_09088 [Ignelater luminosus]